MIYAKNVDYTIPSNNRELRQDVTAYQVVKIIPYQVITGNYDVIAATIGECGIIPYQVITGNYDSLCRPLQLSWIIPYQVITGNYDKAEISHS